jgi:hypothetical protein
MGEFFAQEGLESPANTVFSTDDIPEVIRFIPQKDLIKYLKKRSPLNEKEIQKVLRSLTSELNNSDLWRRPLFRWQKYYFIPMKVFQEPNPFLIFGHIYSLLGYDQVTHTKLFSKWLEDQYSSINNKSIKLSEYVFTIADNGNFQVQLLGKIVIGKAVFCHQPIRSEEIQHVKKQLDSAALEINEHKQFIIDGGETRSITSIIICNLKNFAGLAYRGVCVIDDLLFENYFSKGRLAKGTMSGEFGKEKEYTSFPYYHDEKSFIENLEGFVKFPFPIYDGLDRYGTAVHLITPEEFPIQIGIEGSKRLSEEAILYVAMDRIKDLVNMLFYFEKEVTEDLDAANIELNFRINRILLEIATGHSDQQYLRIQLSKIFSPARLTGFVNLVGILDKTLAKGMQIDFSPEDSAKENIPESDPKKVADFILEVIELNGPDLRFEEIKLPETVDSLITEQVFILLREGLGNHIRQYSTANDFEEWIGQAYVFWALCIRLDKKADFFRVVSNFIERLTAFSFNQKARDLAETCVQLAILNDMAAWGWLCLFQVNIIQKNFLESAMAGCILFTSINSGGPVGQNLIRESLFALIKFYRNFDLPAYVDAVAQTLAGIELEEYERHRLQFLIYTSQLKAGKYEETGWLESVLDYYISKKEEIFYYEENGILPWLSFFFGISRHLDIHAESPLHGLIIEMKKKLNPQFLTSELSFLGGIGEKSKEALISSLVNLSETRNIEDYVAELTNLSPLAESVISDAIRNEDYEGLLLGGLVVNDNTQQFSDKYLAGGEMTKFQFLPSEEAEKKLTEYFKYISENLHLTDGQAFLWLFSAYRAVYILEFQSTGKVILRKLPEWDVEKMRIWILGIKEFKYDDKVQDYKEEQELEYKKILAELSRFSVQLDDEVTEVILSSNLELSIFPPNLITAKGDFMSSQIPVSNAVSIESFISYPVPTVEQTEVRFAAWIPTEGGDFTVNMGYSLLEDVLDEHSVVTDTGITPKEPLSGDINIFLAHGELGFDGFKAVFVEDQSAIIKPEMVFGSGEVAILFICNSSSARPSLTGKYLNSLSMQLLNLGYKVVVAPFWSMQVKIAPKWLGKFLEYLKDGTSVSRANFLANKSLREDYDGIITPTASAIMHVYGNGNYSLLPSTMNTATSH